MSLVLAQQQYVDDTLGSGNYGSGYYGAGYYGEAVPGDLSDAMLEDNGKVTIYPSIAVSAIVTQNAENSLNVSRVITDAFGNIIPEQGPITQAQFVSITAGLPF